jgi:uncharacterized membrane protein
MSDIIVVGFDREDDGLAALRSLRSLEKNARLHLEDTALVTKDPDGTVRVKNEVASGTEEGAVVGAMLGGLLTVVFPVVGLVGGAVVGGLIGRSAKPGIDGAFVKEVTEGLRPGSAALFALVKSGGADSIAAAFRQFKGNVIQTSLDPEYEDALRLALRTTS